MKTKPTKLHGLNIVSLTVAAQLGYASITVDIHSGSEAAILAGVCQHRNPDRACLIETAEQTYQLAIRREDISDVSDED